MVLSTQQLLHVLCAWEAYEGQGEGTPGWNGRTGGRDGMMAKEVGAEERAGWEARVWGSRTRQGLADRVARQGVVGEGSRMQGAGAGSRRGGA